MTQNTKQRALVLAGGGYVASSWEIGVIAGLADAGVNLSNADLIIGTSAGARVALDVTSGQPLEEIYQRRVDASTRPSGAGAAATEIDWAQIKTGVSDAKQTGGSPAEILRRYGALALKVAMPTDPDRRQAVAGQLPLQMWPEQSVIIPAVNVKTGERRAFDRDSGIDLVDAVIATTASFGAPPVLFDGHHYMDGGYHSSDNADLAIGYERVLILALRSPPQAMRLISIETGVDALRSACTRVEVIHPDEQTLAAMAPTGGQMNPASGRPAAIAGREQGQRLASERIAAFWR